MHLYSYDSSFCSKYKVNHLMIMYKQLQDEKESLITLNRLAQLVVTKESDTLILKSRKLCKIIYKNNMLNADNSLEALDLHHPIVGWVTQMSRYHRNKVEYVQNMVMEENVLNDTKVINEPDGCLTAPSVKDGFKPHQLKSKRRRVSLPPKYRMNDQYSQIDCTSDNRTDLEKLRSIMRKINQIYTKRELEENCRVCKRDLLVSEVSDQGLVRGKTFVQALLKHYKRTHMLSLGNQEIYDKIMTDIGYNEEGEDIVQANYQDKGMACEGWLDETSGFQAGNPGWRADNKLDSTRSNTHAAKGFSRKQKQQKFTDKVEASQSQKHCSVTNSMSSNDFNLPKPANQDMRRIEVPSVGHHNDNNDREVVKVVQQRGKVLDNIQILPSEVSQGIDDLVVRLEQGSLSRREASLLQMVLREIKVYHYAQHYKGLGAHNSQLARVLCKLMHKNKDFFVQVSKEMLPHPHDLRQCLLIWTWGDVDVQNYSFNKRKRERLYKIFFKKKKHRLTLLNSWVRIFNKLDLEWPKGSENINNNLKFVPKIDCSTLEEGDSFQGKPLQQICLQVPIGNQKEILVLDTGCSFNIMKFSMYLRVRGLEVDRGPIQKVRFTNIQGQKSTRSGFISHIKIRLGKKEEIVEFFVFINCNEFKKSYLGMQFLEQFKARINMADKTIELNEDKLPLMLISPKEVIELSESSMSNSLTSPPRKLSKSDQVDEVMDGLTFTEEAFHLYGSEEGLRNKVKQILHESNGGVIQTECLGEEVSIEPESGLTPEEEAKFYPTKEVQDFLDKKLFKCPYEEKQEKNKTWQQNNEHLSPEHRLVIEELIQMHPDISATDEKPLGCFKLFKICADVKLIKDASQVKRKVDFALARPCIQRMCDLQIIRRNDSSRIDNPCNLVLVSKTSRLSKADVFERKKESKTLETSGNNTLNTKEETKKETSRSKPSHRITADFSSLNALTKNRSYISMPSIPEVAAKVQDSYVSSIDLADFFSQIPLDSSSKSVFNFYFEDHIMSFDRCPQGWKSSVFYGVLCVKMTFSKESLREFLKKFPKYRSCRIFEDHLGHYIIFFVDDGLLLSPKSFGIEEHFALLHFVFWCLQQAGLKISLHKTKFLMTKFKFLGVWYDTEGHSIPPERINTFRSWPAPTNLGSLNSRLCSLSYYNNYLPYLKIVGAPLFRLAKSNKFVWGEMEQQAWSELMLVLDLAVTLVPVKNTDKLLLTTDSSCFSCGFALLKVSDTLDLEPVMVESRLFTEAEKDAPIVYKEALGVLLALKKSEQYIRASIHPVILFSDCISISYLKKNKNHSPRLMELANLIGNLPNLLPVFLNGKFNILSDLLSRQVYKKVIQEGEPDKSVDELVIDIRRIFGKEINHLSPEGFQKYLISDRKGEYFDLLRKERIFVVKSEHLQAFSHPGAPPAESEFLFLLSQVDNFNVKFLNAKILQNYLLELGKSKLPKHVLTDFIKQSKTRLASQVLKKLFPLSNEQINTFLSKCRINNCPRTNNDLDKCEGKTHRVEQMYSNVSLNSDGDWQLAKSKQETVAVDSNSTQFGEVTGEDSSSNPTQLIEVTGEDMDLDGSRVEEVNRLLMNKQCVVPNSDNQCSHITEESKQILELLKVATRLMLEVNQMYGLSKKQCQDLEAYLINMNDVCHANIIRIKLIYLFLFNEGIKQVFEYATRLKKEVPVLFHQKDPRVELSLETDGSGNRFSLVTNEDLEVPPMSALSLNIEFHLLFNNLGAYIESSAPILGGVCTLQGVQEKPYALYVKSLKIDNFTSENLKIPKGYTCFSYTAVGKENLHVIELDEKWFRSTEANFILSKKFNSLEYYSNILCNQFLKMAEYKQQLEQLSEGESEIVAESLERNNVREAAMQNYKRAHELSYNMPRLLQMLSLCRKDFNPAAFKQMQRVEFPTEIEKAKKHKLPWVIEDELLYRQTKNGKFLVLPEVCAQPLFVRLHLSNCHNMESFLIDEISKVFYVKDKTLRNVVQAARNSCPECSFLCPQMTRNYVGTRRTIEKVLAGHTFFGDCCYLTVEGQDYYVLLFVDLATNYCVTHLMKEISVESSKEFLRLFTEIVQPPDILASDQGGEFSKRFTTVLRTLNIHHRLLDPTSSVQNLAENAIKNFRLVYSKVILNYLRTRAVNRVKLTFDEVRNTIQLATRILNESKPKGSSFSRNSLFWGLAHHKSYSNSESLFQEERHKDSNVDYNLEKVAQYQDYMHLWNVKLAERAKRCQKLNRNASKVILKVGDICLDKKAYKQSKAYNTNQRVYYAVLHVKSPSCGDCIGAKFNCSACRELPTTSVKVINLVTGNITSRNVSSLIPLPSGQLLDPAFVIQTPELRRFDRNVVNDLGYFAPVDSDDIEDDEQAERYNLRSKGHLIGEFSLIEQNGSFFFQGRKSRVTVQPSKNINNEKTLVRKGILKSLPSAVSNDTMVHNCLDYISGNQIKAFVRAIKLSSDLLKEETNPSDTMLYEAYIYKKLLSAYMSGDLQKNISDGISIKEVLATDKKHSKKVNFSQEVTFWCYPNKNDEGKGNHELTDSVWLSIIACTSLREVKCRR